MKDQHNLSDEPIKLVMCGIILFMGISSLLYKHQDWFMELVSFLTWFHVSYLAWIGKALQGQNGLLLHFELVMQPFVEIEYLLNPRHNIELSTTVWWEIQHKAGQAILITYVWPFLYLMFRAWSVRPDLKFRHQHTLDSLWNLGIIKGSHAQFIREFASRHFTQSKKNPSAYRARSKGDNNHNFDSSPADTSHHVRDGPALTPEEWLVHNGLVENPNQDCGDDHNDRLVFNREFADQHWSQLTINQISEVFEDQFTTPWHGYKSLVSYENTLVAVFILHHAFQHKLAAEMLGQLTMLFDRHFPNVVKFKSALASQRFLVKETKKAFQLPSANQLLIEANKHAWKYTAFIAMISAARKETGVLSTAQFLWLKYVDRTLWYTLNNTGNAVASVEAAGVHAHYRAEVQAQMPLYCKRVFQVSRSLLHDYLELAPEEIKLRQKIVKMRTRIGKRLANLATQSQPH